MKDETKICCFCGSKNLKHLYSDLYHPFNKEHGPFSFFKCLTCGSGLTFPIPSHNQLQVLYKSFDGGMIPSIRKIRDKNPLNKWFGQCIARAFAKGRVDASTTFSWLDIGAGNGELSGLISTKYPYSSGVAVDFHSEPEFLRQTRNVSWLQADINEEVYKIPGKVDVIFLVTVLEHILYPDVLVCNLLQKLNKSGILYITVPDFGSTMSKILKKHWPYFLPGEHLYMPTKKGIDLMAERIRQENFENHIFQVETSSVVLPYPLRYYLNYFGINRVPNTLSKISVGFPTGMLETLISID